MFAVFEDGSRQYRVSPGEVVRVDYREAEKGSRVEFSRVLLYRDGADTRIGQPVVEGMRILGEVVEHPSEKYYIQHFRKRKNYRRLKGHRQYHTAVKVQHILLPGQEPPAAPQPPATPPAEQAAPAQAPAPPPGAPAS